MDEEILRDLFSHCIEASKILGTDVEFRNELEKARTRLAPVQIGKNGQLQEWLQDWDAQAPEQKHRHISHLYALYPSAQITPRGTPELAEAAKIALNTRGDITTGWAIAWRINCWARLRDGNRAFSILNHLFDPTRTYPNMFDAHPPFQIDGNFGGASAITEMLLQSHEVVVQSPMSNVQSPDSEVRVLDLLPALPAAWPAGRVTGLRARGGFEVGEEWKEGKLIQSTVKSLCGKPVTLRCGNVSHPLKLKRGATFVWDGR